jgi:hypothetical protein
VGAPLSVDMYYRSERLCGVGEARFAIFYWWRECWVLYLVWGGGIRIGFGAESDASPVAGERTTMRRTAKLRTRGGSRSSRDWAAERRSLTLFLQGTKTHGSSRSKRGGRARRV